MSYNFLCLEILLLSSTTEIIKMPTEVTLSLGFLKLYSLTKQFGLGIFISVGKCKRVCASPGAFLKCGICVCRSSRRAASLKGTAELG